jgi:hypothetical protein
MGADRFVLREKNIVLIYMVHIAYEGDKRQGKHLKIRRTPPPSYIDFFALLISAGIPNLVPWPLYSAPSSSECTALQLPYTLPVCSYLGCTE